MRFGRLDEWLGVVVVLSDIGPNRIDQLLDASERSAADPLVGNLAEPPFDQNQPGTTRRDEMEVKPRCDKLVASPPLSASGRVLDGQRSLAAIDVLPNAEREGFNLVRIRGMTQNVNAQVHGV